MELFIDAIKKAGRRFFFIGLLSVRHPGLPIIKIGTKFDSGSFISETKPGGRGMCAHYQAKVQLFPPKSLVVHTQTKN